MRCICLSVFFSASTIQREKRITKQKSLSNFLFPDLWGECFDKNRKGNML